MTLHYDNTPNFRSRHQWGQLLHDKKGVMPRVMPRVMPHSHTGWQTTARPGQGKPAPEVISHADTHQLSC
jgi:hypothetical protein